MVFNVQFNKSMTTKRVALAKLPSAAAATKATTAEVDRENRERWRAAIIEELVAMIISETEKRRLSLADGADWVVAMPAGAKLVADFGLLGGGTLSAGRLARLAADRITAATTKGATTGNSIERVLEDLKLLSDEAEKLAVSKGWSALYSKYEAASDLIREGKPLAVAMAALKL